MQQVAIEAVGLQPLERTLAGGDGAAPRGVARQDFRDQKNLVALSGDRLGDHQFGIAIHFGGVDVGHAEVDAAAQGGDRALAVATVDIPGALPDHGHVRPFAAEFFRLQDRLVRQRSRADPTLDERDVKVLLEPARLARGAFRSKPRASYLAPLAGRGEANVNGSVIGRRLLIRDAVDRTFFSPRGRAGHRLDDFARAFRIGYPLGVEIVGAGRDATRAFAGIDHAGIAAMDQFIEMVLRLAVAAEMADQALRQRRILDAVSLLAGLAQGAAVEADDRGVAEVGIDAVKAGRIGDRDIDVVGPGHRLGNEDLLFLGRIHVALAAHDQLGTLHGAVTPDFRKVAVVADDQADLEAFRTVGNIGAVAGIPAFDRHPWHDLAVFLDDLALVVHQNQGVVRRLVRMLLVTLAGQRKHAPHFRLAAGFGKDRGFFARDYRGGLIHLLGVVHDAVGGIFREDHKVHSRQA